MKFSKIRAWLSSSSTSKDLLAHIERLGVASSEENSGDYILRRYMENRDGVASTLLSQLKKNPNPWIRLGIIKLFCQIDSLDPIGAKLETSGLVDKKMLGSEWGSSTIVQYLHEANSEREVDMLIAILEERMIWLVAPEIQKQAGELLINIGPRAVLPLLRSVQKCFDHSDDYFAIKHPTCLFSIEEILSRIGGSALNILYQAANINNDEWLRYAAIWAICEVTERSEGKGLPQSISILESAAQSDPLLKIRNLAKAFLDEYKKKN
jgi:hypothetical protein